MLKLPPAIVKRCLRRRILLPSFAGAGMALICAVLSLGRLDWWFEAPWIGWSLALAVVLIVAPLCSSITAATRC
jgi:hypothetical protein